MNQSNRPRRWVPVLVGVLIFGVAIPFMIGRKTEFH
jgi:hypothetical protein